MGRLWKCRAEARGELVTHKIPFTKFIVDGSARENVLDVLGTGKVQGDGPYSRRSEDKLAAITGSPRVVLTSSGTDALEMAAILAGLEPGDEVIMPSFTFVSSANAVVLRGAKPVFCDIDPTTLNLDHNRIEACITPETKAVMPVHYAGIACEMDAIMEISTRHGLKVIEDAAHGMGAYYHGRHLGSIGHFGALSFHETKNISCGEGGALLVSDRASFLRCEVVRDKGTNRKEFLRGEVDRYTWVDVGSSFLPGELQAALLLSQLEIIERINGRRRQIWDSYHEGLEGLEREGFIQRPSVPAGRVHNGHIYWVLTRDGKEREALRQYLSAAGIQATSHYECLHLAPVASSFSRSSPEGHPVTESAAGRILRLPLFRGLEDNEVKSVIDRIVAFYNCPT